MRFEKSDAVADEGVAAVNMLFSRELRWIFREVSKRDVGVDAQVEVCRERLATSRLLALQIKAGESYFTESMADRGKRARVIKILFWDGRPWRRWHSRWHASALPYRRELLKASVRLQKLRAVSGFASERLVLAPSTTACAVASRF
jgi:hypothetical protein